MRTVRGNHRRAGLSAPRMRRCRTGWWRATSTPITTVSRRFGSAICRPWRACLCRCCSCARRPGLVKLGHVALDGTKIKANASKHKAMSYERMCAKELELEAEVGRLLEQAQQVDAAEDAEYGKGRRGDELPAELARRETRLRKIREAKAALEAAARTKAEQAAEQARE